MGALEDLLPEEIKRESTPSGNEFVIPYRHALTAIKIGRANMKSRYLASIRTKFVKAAF